MKGKSYDHLNRSRKVFDKIQQPFLIKILNELDTEEMYLNITKVIYDKPTANIIFSGESLKAFLQRIGIRQEWPPSLLLLNIVLEVLPEQSGQNKKKMSFTSGRKK